MQARWARSSDVAGRSLGRNTFFASRKMSRSFFGSLIVSLILLTMMQFRGAALVFITISSAALVGAHENPFGCVDSFDPDFDYFPHKFSPKFSELFDVEYHNNYKIVTNNESGHKYALLQCGTELPDDFDTSGFEVITVPIQEGASLLYSPYIGCKFVSQNTDMSP